MAVLLAPAGRPVPTAPVPPAAAPTPLPPAHPSPQQATVNAPSPRMMPAPATPTALSRAPPAPGKTNPHTPSPVSPTTPPTRSTSNAKTPPAPAPRGRPPLRHRAPRHQHLLAPQPPRTAANSPQLHTTAPPARAPPTTPAPAPTPATTARGQKAATVAPLALWQVWIGVSHRGIVFLFYKEVLVTLMILMTSTT